MSFCQHCGNEFDRDTLEGTCPECGTDNEDVIEK